MQIDINLVAKMFNRVCEKYVELNGNIIETNIDCIWKIDMVDATDFSKLPDDFCVESLEDAYKELKRVFDDEKEISIVEIERLADIMQVCSYEIEHQNDKYF